MATDAAAIAMAMMNGGGGGSGGDVTKQYVDNGLAKKTNLSEIAEPYDSTRVYNAGDIFEYNGELFQAMDNAVIPTIDIGTILYEKIITGNIFKRICCGSGEQISTTNIPVNSFAFINDDNEKIWINSVSIYNPYLLSSGKYSTPITRTASNAVDGIVQFGLILAKNDLTGISNINDANDLLKIQKIDDNYVVTYANSVMSKVTTQGHSRYQGNNISKGTSPIAYVRAYAVFKNDDNTETVMYTPCKLLSWEDN